TVTMASGITVGMAVCSRNTAALDTSMFDNVTAPGSSSPPAAPSGLTAIAGDAQVSLNWTASSGATSYNVYRASVSGGPYTQIATSVSTTSYTDTTVVNGTTYYYVVTAVNANGESGYSNEASATPCTTPTVPTGLSATGGNAQIMVNWFVVLGSTSYTVKRATSSSGPYSQIASGITTTNYTDTGLASGTTYFYVVDAVNSCGSSGDSAYIGATTIPAVPSGLTATAGSNQVVLSWMAATGATSYNVKRSTTSGGPYTTIASPTTASYTDTTAVNGTTYYYVVSAVNASGESASSAEVSVTPSAPSAPAAPTNLTASTGRRKVTLTWTQSTSSNITTNNVYRATVSGGPYTKIASIAATTNYTNTGLHSGTTYYFVVTAVNSSGLESPYSSQASGTPH
ncbi:MAG TPA: fibronectin type III domain-containing protein, partial [Verrucomicrobiae bacterium]|nr:fibronectin type III domain-containing protein [Verrucomicrobiae bacterium]